MRREQVERCLSTTMTVKDWCALNGVSKSTIYSWMSKFRKEEPALFDEPTSSQWIELTRDSIAAKTALVKADTVSDEACDSDHPGQGSVLAPDARAIIVSMNGAAIAVPAGSKEGDVAAVLRAVASL